MNVLVVDDEKFNLTVAKDLIASSVEDSEIFLCSRPEDVMLILEQEDIGVILLDIIMPRMDGITFLSKLMIAHPMPVIMVSSHTDSGAEATIKAMEAGAVDFILKPVNTED